MFDNARIAALGPELAGLIGGLCPADLDEDRLVAAMAAAERLARWAAAAQLAAIGELVRRPGDPQFVEDEIAAELRLSRPAASHRLALALQLERLPAVGAGLGAGELDLPKARAISEAVAVLRQPTVTTVTEQAVRRAGQQTVGQLRAWLRRAVLAADPAAAEARHDQAKSERRVVLTALPDGMAELWALLPVDDAARAYAAIDACSRDSAPTDDPRCADARRADAMVDLLTGQRAAPSATVQVTIPLATLLALGDQPAQLAGIGPIPTGMGRRLAADGVWRWLATGDRGAVVGVGASTYRPPAALAAHIRGRDQTCRFPGCRQPAHRCDLDHTIPYPIGGTAADNLAALCRHHHRLKHQAGWTVGQHAGGYLTWTSPTGRRYTTSPAEAA